MNAKKKLTTLLLIATGIGFLNCAQPTQYIKHCGPDCETCRPIDSPPDPERCDYDGCDCYYECGDYCACYDGEEKDCCEEECKDDCECKAECDVYGCDCEYDDNGDNGNGGGNGNGNNGGGNGNGNGNGCCPPQTPGTPIRPPFAFSKLSNLIMPDLDIKSIDIPLGL